MYKIYMYTNKINKKVYIGQTKTSLEKRAQKNGSNYKECVRFWNAIQKYGWDNFEPIILMDNLTAEEANKYEEYYISLYNSTDPNVGYNISKGGDNREMTEETRRKISEKAKERYKDPTKNPNYGKHWDEEHREFISKTNSGENNYWYGKHHTEENKKHLSEMFKGTKVTARKTPISDDERERMSLQMKKNSEKWAVRVRCIEDDIIFNTITEAANYYNRSISSVCDVLKGRSKTCAQRRFEYVD